MAEPHPHGQHHQQGTQPPGTHARGNPGAPTAPTPGVSAHEPAAYRTPLWGWIALVAAVAMLGGLHALVVLNLDVARATG